MSQVHNVTHVPVHSVDGAFQIIKGNSRGFKGYAEPRMLGATRIEFGRAHR
jgi:hypothetical protein